MNGASMRRLRAVAAVAAAVLAASWSPTAATAAAPSAPQLPTLTLSAGTAAVGEHVIVTGSGFPVGARLQLEICGIGGSSNSCAIGDAVYATSDAFGGFRQNLPVTEPPTPCPCTVHAAPYAGATADPADAPLSIPGLRFLPQAAPKVAGTAKLLDATSTGDSSFLAQIGADGSARVAVTFGNISGGPAGDPGVVLTLARGGRQVGRYPVAWTGGDLAVGQQRTLTYEVPLPGGWFRDYEIGVAVGGGAKPPVVRTLSASVAPWGELVAPGTLALGVLCLLAGRRRRYTAVAGLPVRAGAPAGRRSGVAVPGPFSAVSAATLGVVVAPGLVGPELGGSGSVGPGSPLPDPGPVPPEFGFSDLESVSPEASETVVNEAS